MLKTIDLSNEQMKSGIRLMKKLRNKIKSLKIDLEVFKQNNEILMNSQTNLFP